MKTALARVAATLLVLSAGATQAVLAPAEALAATVTPATAPRGLTVTRNQTDPNDLDVSWRSPASSGSSALSRYLVTVVADGQTTVKVVEPTTTSLHVTGRSLSSSYRVKVASRNAEGLGSETGYTTLLSAVPGVPTASSGGRSQGDPSTVTVSWGAPTWAGYSAVSAYAVTLRRISDGATWTRTVTGTSTSWSGLSVDRTYTVQVRARNDQGTGVAAGVYVGNGAPSEPRGFTSMRDPQDPTRIRMSWQAPAYAGIGPVTGYQVGHRSSSSSFWSWGPVLPASSSTATMVWPADEDHEFTVRAVNDRSTSYRVPGKRVLRAGAATPVVPATPAVPVVIGSQGSQVVVNLAGNLPGWMTGVDLTLEPQVGSTFTDHTSGPTTSRTFTFGTVPDGTYLVTVRGTSAQGPSVLRSGLVSIGSVGQLGAADWQVVRGVADLSGQAVDITRSGEVRVLDRRNRVSEDATVTTTATLHGGQGYGIWTRATHESDGTESGYSFQVDPGWGNKFIVRHYSHDHECSNPLAFAAFPAGFDANAPHLVQVSVHGDRYVASVDGVERIVVPSLAVAHASSSCASWPVPHGTRVGMRSWGSSSSTFVGTTLTD